MLQTALRVLRSDVLLMQLVKKEMALAIALAQKRFPEGSATGDRRHAAEEEFAQALAKLGGVLNDAVVMAMAAEAFMNLSPWDYYEVSQRMRSQTTPSISSST